MSTEHSYFCSKYFYSYFICLGWTHEGAWRVEQRGLDENLLQISGIASLPNLIRLGWTPMNELEKLEHG